MVRIISSGSLVFRQSGKASTPPRYLKRMALSFHYGQARFRADVPETEHPRPVGDYGHEIRSVGKLEGHGRVCLYLLAGCRHSWGVPNRKVLVARYRALRHDLELPPVELVQGRREKRGLRRLRNQFLGCRPVLLVEFLFRHELGGSLRRLKWSRATASICQ